MVANILTQSSYHKKAFYGPAVVKNMAIVVYNGTLQIYHLSGISGFLEIQVVYLK